MVLSSTVTGSVQKVSKASLMNSNLMIPSNSESILPEKTTRRPPTTKSPHASSAASPNKMSSYPPPAEQQQLHAQQHRGPNQSVSPSSSSPSEGMGRPSQVNGGTSFSFAQSGGGGSWLQGELQKSRETGGSLHSLTGAMDDIHDTLGGSLPPNLPPYPSALPLSLHLNPKIPRNHHSNLRLQQHHSPPPLQVTSNPSSSKSNPPSRAPLTKCERWKVSLPNGTRDKQEQKQAERQQEERQERSDEEEDEEEERTRQRVKFRRPRTPKPTSLGVTHEDDEEPRRWSSPWPYSVIDQIFERLATLSSQLESVVELSNTLQAQQAAA
ncbi:hypothetical protein PILCRDRAFT_12776 [Piloderma croceum F 1598]|uniref:Uncharacterized protein n=1 Tax=Piloderma croceum (strain F 1598) TaxID=765440 RepID=A0A0C3BGT2_PILCF|nr:hypothetical protein PILCRDRAFT_12776 [Piloderma croceum F 1598]